MANALTPGPGTTSGEVDPSRGADVADILAKAAQPCWAISLRYAVTTQECGKGAALRLRGRAHAVASAFALFSGRNRFDRKKLARPLEALAQRRLGRGDLVSVDELSALAHLPTDVSVPGLARAGAKAVAPPPAVARFAAAPLGSGTGQSLGPTGIMTPKLLGDAQAGGRRPVSLGVADARFHLHVMGATGSGKSPLLTNLVLGDVAAGRGVVVIDPKGDLITDLCDRLPAGSAERTVLIDPEDAESAPVLNVLDGSDPDLVVDNLVGIFRSIFAAFWGPRTDDVFRSACLTLMRYAAATGTSTSLADVPRLLSDDRFRAPRVAAVVHDTVGLGGFWLSYEAMSESNRAQVIGPLMNKLRAFLLRDFVRSVVGRPDSSFDMGKILDGGICLVRVPKGILGEETARLLGSFVVAQVWQSALHRAQLGQSARVDATLVVDECQNFLNLPRSFDEMLAEARGYRLLHGAGPPTSRSAAQRTARSSVGQRALEGLVLHESRGRSRALAPRRTGNIRARPGSPRCLYGGGAAGGRRRGDPGVHLVHQERSAGPSWASRGDKGCQSGTSRPPERARWPHLAIAVGATEPRKRPRIHRGSQRGEGGPRGGPGQGHQGGHSWNGPPL